MRRMALLMGMVLGLTVGLTVAGCGSKKSKVNDGDDADAGPAMDPEASTGPVEYPEPPQRASADRNPISFKVSVKKAYALPLSADGACFDECTKETKTRLVDALKDLSGDQFGSAAKALTTELGAKGMGEALPDIYMHIDCGAGQTITTNKSSAENRLAAIWQGAGDTLKLDVGDECAISVWDADDDGNDELIGSVQVPLFQVADGGSVVLTSENHEMGQVYLVELFLDQLEGSSVLSGSGGSSETTGTSTSSSDSGSAGGGEGTYTVQIISANVKDRKKTGEKWDTKLPFVGKADDELPDPFCSAFVNGYKSAKPFMKTSAASNAVEADWGETGNAALNAGDKIFFMVWDKDTADHDLIGECVTDAIGNLSLGQTITINDCGQVSTISFKITRN